MLGLVQWSDGWIGSCLGRDLWGRQALPLLLAGPSFPPELILCLPFFGILLKGLIFLCMLIPIAAGFSVPEMSNILGGSLLAQGLLEPP